MRWLTGSSTPETPTLVEQLVAILQRHGWEALPESTFAIAGERGSIDILAWHAGSATLLVIEVKSVVPDVQGAIGPFDRKVRLASDIARRHGWSANRVASLFVIGDTRTSRRRVDRHAATFEARFPDRIVAIRQFLARPASVAPIHGLWFLPFRTRGTARHRASSRRLAA